MFSSFQFEAKDSAEKIRMSAHNKARKDPRVKPLLSEIQEIYKVQYHRSEMETWSAEVEDSVLNIGYSKTKNPGGALAHELLHGWVQHCGYRRLILDFSAIDNTSRFTNLVRCLDNELQHHKMYPRFKELGFGPIEFYCDSDVDTPEILEFLLNRSDTDLLDLLPNYFTAIAPGGSLSSEDRSQFDKRFRALYGGKYSRELSTIYDSVNEWASSDDFDAKPVIASILHQFKDPCDTWFGHTPTDRPPNQGFFVDREFGVIEK